MSHSDKKMITNLIIHCVMLLVCFIVCIVVLSMDFSTAPAPADAAYTDSTEPYVAEQSSEAETSENDVIQDYSSLNELSQQHDEKTRKENDPFNKDMQTPDSATKTRILKDLEENKDELTEAGVDYNAIVSSDLSYYLIGDNGYCIPTDNGKDVIVYFIDNEGMSDYVEINNTDNRNKPSGDSEEQADSKAKSAADIMIAINEKNTDILEAYGVDIDALNAGLQNGEYSYIETYDPLGNTDYQLTYDNAMLIDYLTASESVKIEYKQ